MWLLKTLLLTNEMMKQWRSLTPSGGISCDLKFSVFFTFPFMSFLYNREEIIYKNGDKNETKTNMAESPEQAHCG